MIKNNRQLKVTEARIEQFKITLEELDRQPENETPTGSFQREMNKRALQSMLDTLTRQVDEYLQILDGNTSKIKLDGLHDLPKALIQTRIAKGWTQKDLAAQVGVQPQQVQRWEQENYDRITFSNLEDVANALGISKQFDLKRTPTPNQYGALTAFRANAIFNGNVLSWYRNESPYFTHASGNLVGAANAGSGTGHASLQENTGGLCVKISGLGDRFDGTYTKTSNSVTVRGETVTWKEEKELSYG